MILGFKKQFPDKTPTNFEQKIMEGQKIHSIRSGSRWSSGRIIHFATGVRTKKYNCFKKVFCVSVQEINIRFDAMSDGSKCMDDYNMVIEVDGRMLPHVTIVRLALNDGLLYTQFKRWFFDASRTKVSMTNSSFFGQLIHWTDFKY